MSAPSNIEPKDESIEDMRAILEAVRDAGALDDNHGGVDWTGSDAYIETALKQLEALLIKGQMSELELALKDIGELPTSEFSHVIIGNIEDRLTQLSDRLKKLKGE